MGGSRRVAYLSASTVKLSPVAASDALRPVRYLLRVFLRVLRLLMLVHSTL